MKKKGFTLVELMVAITTFAVLLSGIFYALGVELNFWKKLVSVCEKQQIANMVITRILCDARSAREILPASNKDQLLLKSASDTLVYSLIKGKVKRKKNNYSSYLTTKGDIEEFAFSYPKAKLLEIRVDGFTAKAALRN